tara:strand:+ start:6809 stop:9370 length:2562 start_codon:yes stop_codon:yes gene_type:complete
MSNSSFYTSSGTSQTLERSVSDAAADAEKLATNPEDSQFTLSTGATGFSALHHNAKAEDEKTEAQTAKTQAETARNTAQNHRDDAQKLAAQAEDSQFTLTDGVTTGFSALHYNAKALAAKTAAESAQSLASTSETNAASSAGDAADDAADAEKLAITAHNTQFTLSDGQTTGYSALHYSTEAANALATFTGQYHGAAASDPTTGLDVGDLYYKTGSGIRAYSGSAWEDVKPSSSEQTNINTIASNITGINALVNAIGVSTTFAVTVANGVFYIDGVANPTLTLDRGNTYIFNVADSSVSGHPLAFKEGSSSYTTGVTVSGTAGQAGATVTIDVASNAPSSLLYYCTVHGNGMGNTISVVNSNLSLVASNITSVNTVANATNLANITAVAGDATDIGNVAANITGTDTIGTVANATNLANITTVADSTNLSNITTVADSTNIANINTLASSSNLSQINGFAQRYQVGSSAPSNPNTGDLWFDTSGLGLMRVYNGNNFVIATGTLNGTSQRQTYTATAGQTTFAAEYDAGFLDVYLNGIKLINGTDFTATNGTSVVLASGASLNDTVDIVGYGTFSLLSFSATSMTSGTIPDARFPSVLPAIDGSALTNLTQVDQLTNSGSTKLSTYGNGVEVTGDILISGGVSFEGATADAYETTLNVEDPTGDRTVLLPNASGTLGYVALSTVNITSNTTSITFDNLPAEFDTFDIVLHLHPNTDNDELRIRFLDTSGNEISSSHYQYTYARGNDNTSPVQDPNHSYMKVGNSVGHASHEGIRLVSRLVGRNYTDDSNQVPPQIFGQYVEFSSNGGYAEAGYFNAGFDIYQQAASDAIRGIKFYFGYGDIAQGTAYLYGVRNA